jgi:hypothetical protein
MSTSRASPGASFDSTLVTFVLPLVLDGVGAANLGAAAVLSACAPLCPSIALVWEIERQRWERCGIRFKKRKKGKLTLGCVRKKERKKERKKSLMSAMQLLLVD